MPVENEEGDVGACAVTGLTVKSAILFNANTGEVLYEQNPDFQIPPASLTKVLTLYLIFDAIREGRLRPWDVVDVSERASTQGGSNMMAGRCHFAAPARRSPSRRVAPGSQAMRSPSDRPLMTSTKRSRPVSPKASESVR